MDNKDWQTEDTEDQKAEALTDEEYVGRFQAFPQETEDEPSVLPSAAEPTEVPEEAPDTPVAVTASVEEAAEPTEEAETGLDDIPAELPIEAPLLDPMDFLPEEAPSGDAEDAEPEDAPVAPVTEASEVPDAPVIPVSEEPEVPDAPVSPVSEEPEVPDAPVIPVIPGIPLTEEPVVPQEMPLSEIEAILHPREPEVEPAAEQLPSDPDGAEINDITRILSGSEEAAEAGEASQETPAAEDPILPEELTETEEPPADQSFQNMADSEEFDEMFHAQPEPPKTPARKRPARKGRPKRKKGEGFFGIPNLLVTLVWLAITVLIGVTLGRMIWVCAADVLAFGREVKPVTITIYETDTIEDITQKLYEGELIHYPGLFKLYASLAVDEGEIQPGIWDLNTRYDYHALVNMMSPSSSREVIKVMIPEGYTSRQIFSLLEENKVCTIRDLSAYAADGDLGDYWFLEGVERGDPYCLDGFLFPDTYQFYKNESPENVLGKLLDNFNNRFDEEMQAQIVTLNQHLTDLMRKGGKSEDFIAQNQFTIREVVIVASMIEKETSSAEEGYTIASVIYNRLFNWGSNPAYLNIDASIVYALEGKTDLTQEDLRVDSPFNTYTHTGLTPGAISNPGLASLKAALAPQDTNYYYYVLDPSIGAHRFTTNYDEHQAAIASIGGQE